MAPNSDDDDPVLPLLPPHIELLSLVDFTKEDIADMNNALNGNTHYRFTFAEGGSALTMGVTPEGALHFCYGTMLSYSLSSQSTNLWPPFHFLFILYQMLLVFIVFKLISKVVHNIP